MRKPCRKSKGGGITDIFKGFLAEYGSALVYTVVAGIISYVGLTAKKLSEKYFADKEKNEIATISVNYAEQVYKQLHGNEKLEKAMLAAVKLLNERGIKCGDEEMRIFIESAVAKLNK